MKIGSIGSDAIPKVKASLPEIAKFLLLALGWILGRFLHVQIANMPQLQSEIVGFPAILDNKNHYSLTSADVATLAVAAIIGWVLYKWGKMFKWLGVGIFLYIVTFELYEMLWGGILSTVSPPTSLTGGM